jgi:hypothetical protein
MKGEKLYICKVPLIADHRYTQPYDKRTIDETYGSWWVVTRNDSKNEIILAQSKDQNIRMALSVPLFEKHFEEV